MGTPTNPRCSPEHCADPRDRCAVCPRLVPAKATVGVAEIVAQQQMQQAIELDRILAEARARGITTVRVQNGILGTIEYDLTERTAEHIRDRVDAERHKGGFVTPCGDWVAPHEVTAHAEQCRTCQQIVAETHR